MPVLNQFGYQYAKQGLVILAVNVGDKKSSYQSYIRSKNYAYLQWARDGSGEISDMYRVHGVPTTYILDREGLIRYVHVGYGDGLKATLAQEIESLLE